MKNEEILKSIDYDWEFFQPKMREIVQNIIKKLEIIETLAKIQEEIEESKQKIQKLERRNLLIKEQLNKDSLNTTLSQTGQIVNQSILLLISHEYEQNLNSTFDLQAVNLYEAFPYEEANIDFSPVMNFSN